MSKDAGKKGCRDPAIKLFGTTIAVPTDLMKTGYDSFQTPSGTAEKSPPSSQDGNTSGKKETEELRVLVSTGNQHLSASAILLERESHQSMDQGTDLQGPGMTSSVNFDANMVPLRRRRVELDFSYVVEPQERSCRRSGKVVACPRCDSMDTKFCYYNNYNVNQPRHFCKNCQRYWTAGGTLRNVPIGAGRRKNKSGVPVTPRNLISENGSVRADATDSALPCGLTPAFGMKPNCSSSDIYFQCGKRLGIPALVPCMWPESGASIVGNWIKDTVTGRGSVCRDELVQLSLKLKSGADSISTPGKYRPNLQGDPSAEGTSKSPSVLCGECSDWTASSRFSGSWSHGYDIDWNGEMVSPLGGSVFVPNSPKLDPMVENSINEEKAHKTMSVRPGSWTTMSWVNIWCMPEWPVGDAFYPCPFSISPWGKHFLEGRHMESKGVSCAPSTDDLGCNYYPCMWSSPKSQAANPSALPNVFHQKTEIMEQGLGGQNRHTNPAALTRSMVFHEFN